MGVDVLPDAACPTGVLYDPAVAEADLLPQLEERSAAIGVEVPEAGDRDVVGGHGLLPSLQPGRAHVIERIRGSTEAGEAVRERHCLLHHEGFDPPARSEEHTSELQSLMRISY